MPDRLNGDPTQSRSVEAAGVAPASVKTSLLIIEDDDNISTAIEEYFSRAGYAVSAAPDGIAGVETATKNRPDVVVLDLMLPKMDGLASIRDRKSTRLNSSHGYISYAVFCLIKKKSRNRVITQVP